MNIVEVAFRGKKIAVGVALALILAYVSGWRESGIDRQNYHNMYQQISGLDDFESRMFYAKDLMYLAAVLVANGRENGEKMVFLFFTFLGAFTKLIFSLKAAPNRFLPFLILYLVFLSPSLEFAAIRAAVSIGFLLLSIFYREKTWLFLLFAALGISAHLSVIVPLLFVFKPVNQCLTRWVFLNVFLTLFVIIFGDLLFSVAERSSVYLEDRGSYFAYLEPLCTLFVAYLLFFKNLNLNGQDVIKDLQFISVSRGVVFGLISVSFGVIQTSVTSSTRFLESAWCLLLFVGTLMVKGPLTNRFGLMVLIFLLTFGNLRRSTWVAIFQPDLF
jgi:hypothetical protein